MNTKTEYATPLTPARQRLAALIAEREAASTELENLTARSHRLVRAKETIAPLEGELNALSLAETSAMLRWSESDDASPPPVADVARRAEIEGKLAGARAQARSADSATASISSQLERVAATIRAIELRIAQIIAEIISEEAMSLFPEVKAKIAAADDVGARVMGARQFLAIATERPLGQAVGAIRYDFGTFDSGFEIAAARPFTPAVGDASEWFGFASRLNGDATATL